MEALKALKDLDLDLDLDLGTLSQGLVHLVALVHPDPAVASRATVAEIRLCEHELNIVAIKSQFKENIQRYADRTVTFSDGTTMSHLDDRLFDRRFTGPIEDRKLAMLTMENVGYPENVKVLAELRTLAGPDWADRQAQSHGFRNADHVRQIINSYIPTASASSTSASTKIPYWCREIANTSTASAGQCYPFKQVIAAFCKLWSKLGLDISFDDNTFDLWGVPMYLLRMDAGTIMLQTNGKRASSFKVSDGLSHCMVPFGPVELSGSQVSRLFHELGHGVHHALRSSEAKPILFEVPSTLMEHLLRDQEIAKSIGLEGIQVPQPSALSIMTDICYSMYCLDFFSGRDLEHLSMCQYYDKYFPEYTREDNPLHTECNLVQIVNYQSAYYIYIIADIIVYRLVSEFQSNWEQTASKLRKFLTTSVSEIELLDTASSDRSLTLFDRYRSFSSYEEFCIEFEKINAYSESITELILTFDRLWSNTSDLNDMLDFVCGFYPNLRILVININYFYSDGTDVCIHHIPEGLEELWLIGNQQMEYDFTYTQTNDLKLLVTEVGAVRIPKQHSYDYLNLLDTPRPPAHLIEKIKKYES